MFRKYITSKTKIQVLPHLNQERKDCQLSHAHMYILFFRSVPNSTLIYISHRKKVFFK